jgi:hypothetical protein
MLIVTGPDPAAVLVRPAVLLLLVQAAAPRITPATAMPATTGR